MPQMPEDQFVRQRARIAKTLHKAGLEITEVGHLSHVLTGKIEAFVEAWSTARWDFPDHLPFVEARIIGRILDDALAIRDVFVAVHDEVEMSVAPTRHRTAIEKEVAATGITYLTFHRVDSESKLGAVMLVHGNCEDVISDYSANDWTDAILFNALALSEELGELT